MKNLTTTFNYLADLNYVERYGGLIKLAKKTTFDENGVKAGELVFPVSSSVNDPQCYENNTVFNLVPDSSKKGIVYIERSGDTQTSVPTLPARYQMLEIKESLALVVWLNLPFLGQTSDDISAYVEDMIKQLTSTKGVLLTSIKQDDSTIFNKYTYSDSQKGYLGYPYAVFSINFTYTYMIKAGCIVEIEEEDAIECV